ncbi:hypothetical protein DICPUDRAFT_76093 [Dictyostelium purpureum]|uniref:Cytochrome-b5 reductase n=1 Tax=Dictyostelium purpureum TaxID=5786 RepID=F0ZCK5_DICPU|nr:uncharacterized protein DICPUDRAFT_76093 [Dictyostelium purpureum]EGC38284.1 hypothetical protein DICPUDRAFT_76093 [Dictyostelium purpureum]|eukprot:XP_003285145.1 hypothetical protein DICPUDRAFT_76093 [Dictyostelium purpureum]
MSGPPFISDMVLNLVNKTMARYEGRLGKSYTLEEISKHNTPDDFWVIVRGKVYDLGDYLMMHPGGPKLLFKHGGKDATEDFEGMFHSRNAKAILEKFWIGKVNMPTASSSSSFLSPNNLNFKSPNNLSFKSPSPKAATTLSTTTLNTTSSNTSTTNAPPSHSKVEKSIILSKVKIHKKSKHTENTYHYQIELPEEHLNLNWISPLSHVSLSKHHDSQDSLDFKSYTPIKQTDDKKYLEFLIKGYDNGNVSKHIHQLSEGDYLSLKGPIETNESFNFGNQKDYLLMVAGGTGITPMIQILYETFYGKNKPNEKLKFILIYSSNSQDEIIYKKELDQMKEEFNDRLFIHYIITQPKSDSGFDEKTMKKGRINQDLILTCLEPIIIKIIPKMITDAMDVLVCGPVQFNNFQSDELLRIGFKSNQIHLLQ